MTTAIDQIDRINEILSALQDQAGAIATMTNPQYAPGNMEHVSNCRSSADNQGGGFHAAPYKRKENR